MASEVIQLDRTQVASPTEWAEKIAKSWNKSVESILETARLVREADEALESKPALQKQYEKELDKRGISDATRSKLRKIGASDYFKDEQLGCLPPSYNYLYELAKLQPHQYDKVYTRLSEGKEFREATLVLRAKNKSKNKRERVLFTLVADVEKMTASHKAMIERFVESLDRKNVIRVKTSPTYRKLFAEDVE